MIIIGCCANIQGYKDGQIDALHNKFKYEIIKDKNGEEHIIELSSKKEK
jgi:hypothetical protein